MIPLQPHPAKIDLNKKWLPKEKTIQNFNIDAQGFGKTRNKNLDSKRKTSQIFNIDAQGFGKTKIENPPMREMRVTS